jgi:uncharacterized glyoxalase superfamily protein PhnB
MPPMTTDPFDVLYLPIIAIRPRADFLTALQRRVSAVLDEPISQGETDMVTDVPTRTSVEFALHYRDVNSALRWLNDVIGLTTEWVHPQSGQVQHAGMRWGDGTFSINYKRGIYELGPGSVILTVPDGELDARYQQVTNAGADIARPLGANWDGRSRNFVVRDPEGNLWELSS